MILAAITTCRRKPEMLNRAIQSVVNQTYHDWELVIVDDSPSDYEFRSDVKKLVEDWNTKDNRIKYIPLDKNYGLSYARDVALKIAANTQSGGHDFIAFLDDDDEWLPEKLEKQLAKFNECGENTLLVSCGYYEVDDDRPEVMIKVRTEDKVYDGNLYDKIFYGIPITVFCMIRTKSFAKIGGFDPEVKVIEDVEAWIRFAKNYNDGKFVCMSDILGIHHSKDGREHLAGNLFGRVRTLELIIEKNYDYLIQHKHHYYSRLNSLLHNYMFLGEYKNFFKTLLKIISLEPKNILRNIWIIIKSLVKLPYLRSIELIRRKLPKLFIFLNRIRKKIKRRNLK